MTHALGIHGIQVLSGLALLLSATAMTAAMRRRLITIAAVGYTGLLVAGTLQWFDGRALTQVGWSDGIVWVASIVTLTAVAATALRATPSPSPVTH